MSKEYFHEVYFGPPPCPRLTNVPPITSITWIALDSKKISNVAINLIVWIILKFFKQHF